MNIVIKRFSIFILAALFLVVISLAHATNEITGKVVGITDGDTITVLQDKTSYKIRLYGIDCPESHQDFGIKAKQFTSDLVYGKQVKAVQMDIDRKFGRTVGIVYIGDLCVNDQIIKNGLAWVYQRYCDTPICKDWLKLEQQARSSKIGLWSHPNPIPPWDFRKGHKASSQPASTHDQSDVAGYHGNVNSKVFHQPTCKDYNCKNCTVVFNSREEVVSQGYRPCGMCNP
jgi:micrococcal nuclease